MKKRLFSLGFSLILTTTLLAGCGGNDVLALENGKLKNTIEELELELGELQGQMGTLNDPRLIVATTTDPRGSQAWTSLSSFDFDYDLNGEEETLMLFTAAEKDEKGRIMWDDGQEWLLMLKDKSSFYNIFQEYVQIGSVQFSVSRSDDKTPPTIQLMVSTGASLSIYNISYDVTDKAYKAIHVYESGVLNQFFTSMPEYQ